MPFKKHCCPCFKHYILYVLQYITLHYTACKFYVIEPPDEKLLGNVNILNKKKILK